MSLTSTHLLELPTLGTPCVAASPHPLMQSMLAPRVSIAGFYGVTSTRPFATLTSTYNKTTLRTSSSPTSLLKVEQGIEGPPPPALTRLFHYELRPRNSLAFIFDLFRLGSRLENLDRLDRFRISNISFNPHALGAFL